jgi:hypothetical protein
VHNPIDPDTVFNGALAHPVVGPNFLTWDTFSPNPAQNDPLLQVANPDNPSLPFQFVGITGIEHAIAPGPNGVAFTIEGPANTQYDQPVGRHRQVVPSDLPSPGPDRQQDYGPGQFAAFTITSTDRVSTPDTRSEVMA